MQQDLLQQLDQQPADNNIQQPAQAQDANEAALAHLSGKDRATAELFLKGLSVQETAKHTKWGLGWKVLFGVFSFGIAPAIMCRKEAAKEKQLADDAVHLKNTLNHMASQNHTVVRNVKMDDQYIPVVHNVDTGTLSATIGGQTVVSKFSPKALAEIIEKDIVTNTNLYGKQAALDVLSGTDGTDKKQAGPAGHAGKSLAEQQAEAMKVCDQRIAKAEAAVKADKIAVDKLQQELDKAQNALDQLQNEFNQTETDCNQILLQSNDKLETVATSQRVLDADLAFGIEDKNGQRQKSIDRMRTEATEAKNNALDRLRTLEQRKPELYAAIAKRDKLLNDHPALVELRKAREEKDELTAKFHQKHQNATERLNELNASPDRNTAAVQNEIRVLNLYLTPPQEQNALQQDPLALNISNPEDALDSKGLNDSHLRELCLKSIKAEMGIDAGELHSCPTRYLSRIARYAVEGYFGSAINLLDHVLKISTTTRIANQDVMELMNVREQDANSGQKVNVAVLKPQVNPFATATHQQVANFAADIIYSGNIVDEDKLSPEDRLRKVLNSNAGVIADVIKVETGLNAVELETKARQAEQNASKPNATEADRLEAKIARAEADAAQFEAKALRGSNIVKGIGNIASNIVSFFSGPKKPDEAKFTSLEALACAAEAKMLREEKPLLLRVHLAQAEVAEHEDDPLRLAELTDAQKALSDFEKSPIFQEATAARLAVRLARAEAQADLSKNEADIKKAAALRTAIEGAKPGVPDATLGSEFDVPANTALEKRLASLEDLPEAERTSLLASIPQEMGEALKSVMGEMRVALLENDKHADTLAISAGIAQLESKDLKTIVKQVNASVTQAAQMVQEEMTTAILMMDETLSVPTKAVLREFKAALESENLPLTEENAEALLARKPQPQALSSAMDVLTSSITGVDDPAQRRNLAGKVAINQFVEYIRLADNAKLAQDAATQAENATKEAIRHETVCKNEANAKLHDVLNTDEAWAAKENQAKASREAAEQAENAANNAESKAQSLENEFAALPQNAREALQLEEAAAQAERRSASLQAEAVKAKDAADEAELQALVAGAPADAGEKARAARKVADEAAANAASAVREATDARNAANVAAGTVAPQALQDARSRRQAADTARQQAVKARALAVAAQNTANLHQAEEAAAKKAYNDASEAYSAAVKAHEESETAQAQAKAAKTKAQTAVETAQAEAEAALGVDHDGNPIAAAQANAPGAQANAAQTHEARLAQLQNTDLNTLAAAAGTDFNSDGIGKFIKFVIQDYFQSMPLMDQRGMVSAGLRYAPANATAMQKLGAMLKGAGPVLQKIFQGLDGPGLPQDLRIACQDMKSRLAPIPPDIVEANLLDMVNSSNGRIRNIEVISSLGAASVGEAFRCRITNQNGQTRECVIKILRPDAANRVQREKPIFEKAAAKVPGMSGTFRGQMEGILEELDFGIEAGNAKLGTVYNKPFDGQDRRIQSVNVVEDIPPKSNSMAMEMAPGTTLDGFLRDTREEIERMGKDLGRSEEFNAQGQREYVTYDVPETRLNELAPVKLRLQELYDQAEARHKQLTALADVWVTEGIFGEQGFFHGDLHAGNIMSDGKQLTVIDFGNATKLSQEQQCAVMTMIVATTTRQSDKFVDSFRAMLPPQAQAVFDGKKQQILESVRVIMKKGNLGDTGGRIAAILSEIQRNGVEIPHAIFNFSSSQIRLANSINEMITLMSHIREEMRAIDTLRSVRSPETLPFDRNIISTPLAAMADEGQTSASVISHIDNLIAQIRDVNSELNQEEDTDVRQALSMPTYMMGFKAKNVDNDPVLLEFWNQNKDALENVRHSGHDAAITELIKLLRSKALNTLSALKAEEEKDHSRQANPDTFLDVMGDVVNTNKSGAINKLGVFSSVKYGITSFVSENITSWVQPQI